MWWKWEILCLEPESNPHLWHPRPVCYHYITWVPWCHHSTHAHMSMHRLASEVSADHYSTIYITFIIYIIKPMYIICIMFMQYITYIICTIYITYTIYSIYTLYKYIYTCMYAYMLYGSFSESVPRVWFPCYIISDLPLIWWVVSQVAISTPYILLKHCFYLFNCNQ